jgi:hypothetical protein
MYNYAVQHRIDRARIILDRLLLEPRLVGANSVIELTEIFELLVQEVAEEREH